MFDIEDNFTNDSDYGNYTGKHKRQNLLLLQLYLALPLRIIMSLAIVISASIVLLAIKKSKKETRALHFFFIANLMITDIGVVVIRSSIVIVNMIMTLVNPMREGMDCRIMAVATFPTATNSMMLAALCFDRLYSIAAPHHYRRNMTKRKGCVIVLVIWLIPFALSFVSFFDPHITSTKTKGAICGVPLYKNFGLAIITLPFILSAVFVVIQNIYLYRVVLKTIIRNDSGEANNNTVKGMKKAWKTFKETQKASITLSILSGTSIIFGITNPVILTIVQSQVRNGLVKVVIFPLVVNFTFYLNILLHSLLYGYFLHSIRESLGLNTCLCFRRSSE